MTKRNDSKQNDCTKGLHKNDYQNDFSSNNYWLNDCKPNNYR